MLLPKKRLFSLFSLVLTIALLGYLRYDKKKTEPEENKSASIYHDRAIIGAGETNSLLDEVQNLSSTAPNETKIEPPKVTLNEKDFLSEFPGPWNFRKNDLGLLSGMMGGRIKGVGAKEENLLNFAKRISKYFDVKPEQISGIKNGVKSLATQQWILSQHFEGVPVYSGRLQLSTSLKNTHSEEGDIVLITSQLVPNVHKPVNQKPKLLKDAEEVAESITKHYNSDEPVVLLEDKGLMVYQSYENKRNYWAHVVIAKVKQDQSWKHLQVVLDANDLNPVGPPTPMQFH